MNSPTKNSKGALKSQRPLKGRRPIVRLFVFTGLLLTAVGTVEASLLHVPTHEGNTYKLHLKWEKVERFFHFPTGPLSLSEAIENSEPMLDTGTAPAWYVLFINRYMPDQFKPAYYALHHWPSVVDPKLNPESLYDGKLSLFFQTKALDQLSLQQQTELIAFLSHVIVGAANNPHSMMSAQERLLFSFDAELQNLKANETAKGLKAQQVIDIFTPRLDAMLHSFPLGISPQEFTDARSKLLVQVFEDDLYNMKTNDAAGHPVTIDTYSQLLASDEKTCSLTATDYQLAQENGLVDLAKLIAKVLDDKPDASTVLTIIKREIGNMNIGNMQGYGRDSGKTAAGPFQITTPTMIALMQKHGDLLVAKTMPYTNGRDARGNWRIKDKDMPNVTWLPPALGGTIDGLGKYKTLKTDVDRQNLANNFKDNYFGAPTLDSIELEDQGSNLKWHLANVFKIDISMVDARLTHMERLVLINFLGPDRGNPMAVAYMTDAKHTSTVKIDNRLVQVNENTRIDRILSPQQISESNLTAHQTVKEFFAAYVLPSQDFYDSFEMNRKYDCSSLPKEPLQLRYAAQIKQQPSGKANIALQHYTPKNG